MARNFVKSSTQRIATTFPSLSSEISIVCSYKHSSTPGDSYPNRRTFLSRETGSTINYFLYATSSAIALAWTSSANVFHGFNITQTSDSSFHTIAVSHLWGSSGSTIAYIDGAQATIDTIPLNLTQTLNMTSQNIGGRPAAGNVEYFDGDIANLAIYDKCLTADQLRALSKNFSPIKIQRANLKYYSPLIRELNDIMQGQVLTNSGTTASNHPRIYA